MRLTLKHVLSQLMIFLCLFVFLSCRGNREENEVIPPVTSPLSNEYIGYGVITDSFTHVTADPQEDSASLGYLRRGSVIRIIRRQSVKVNSQFQSWVLTDEPQYGWLKESVMDVYDTESQAKTASNLLTGAH